MVFRNNYHSGLSFRSESPTCFRSGLSTGQSVSLGGAVEKSRQRRSRHFSVLTYDSFIRSAQKNGCGLAKRTFLNRPSELIPEGIGGKYGF